MARDVGTGVTAQWRLLWIYPVQAISWWCISPPNRSIGSRCGQYVGMKCNRTRHPGWASHYRCSQVQSRPRDRRQAHARYRWGV